MTSLESLTHIIQKSTNLLIYAGAGMSLELGSNTYWSGGNNRYGGEVTKYGLTPVEHATEEAWHSHLVESQKYAQELRTNYLMNLQNSDQNLYTELLRTINEHNIEYFVVTSNVDNAFNYYGYNSERIYEKHGNYFNDQCVMNHTHPVIPHNSMVTKCTVCDSPLRPNVLMFYDTRFSTANEVQQYYRYDNFLGKLEEAQPSNTTILEIGVGTTVLNIRDLATKAYYMLEKVPYIHLNPNIDPTNNYSQLASLISKTEPSAPEVWIQESGSSLTNHLILP